MHLLSLRTMIWRQNAHMSMMALLMATLTIGAYVAPAVNMRVHDNMMSLVFITDGVVMVMTARNWDVLDDLGQHNQGNPVNPILVAYYWLGIATMVAGLVVTFIMIAIAASQ